MSEKTFYQTFKINYDSCGSLVEKRIPRKTALPANVKAEFEIIGSINFPLIQKVVDSTFTSQSISLFVESEDVNLIDFYREIIPLPEDMARQIFCDLSQAVCHLHNNNFVHLDIRLDKVYSVDGNFRLGGFSRARYEIPEEMIVGNYGTPEYQAPEIYLNNNFDGRKADVWACGIFLYVLLTGHFPYTEIKYEKDPIKQASQIKEKVLTEDIHFESYLSDDVTDLLKTILVKDPSRRPTMQATLDHKWLSSIKDIVDPKLPVIVE